MWSFIKKGMWRVGFLVALLFCLFACKEEKEPEPDSNQVETPETIEPNLKVMTYNIHLANPPSAGTKRDLAAIARVINTAQPDLVALQEVDIYTERSGINVHQARELGKLTNMQAFFVGAMDVFNGGQYGIAILSKFPFLDSVGYALPADPSVGGEMRKLAVVRVALPNGKEVVFAGTHLDHKSEENRLYQGKRILQVLKGEQRPVILAGDFNALPNSLTLNLFSDLFTRTCRHNCSPTFPAYNPKSPIDFIMYTQPEKVKAATHKVIQESYASDHLPVMAGLKIE